MSLIFKSAARALGALLCAATLLGAAQAGPVTALSGHAYMSAANEPFDDFSNAQAMNAAFGQNWNRLQFGSAFSNYSLLYIDGGDLASTEMVSFLAQNRSALESYVLGGGRLFINAATDQQSPFDLVFGASSVEQSIDNRSNSGSAVNPGSDLFSGAGDNWLGYYFGHNTLSTDSSYSALIRDEQGRTVLAGGFFGNGYVMLGGQTNTVFHEGLNGSDPVQLRVNELLYTLNTQPGRVDEPATLALLAISLTALVVVRRSRRGL
ncbi:PEP-CTERM sorting domain-containing protein [Paucibacter sp. O1-1]|uniref:PEP-CTERM sorting domain-containing protein n=1 Tax=Paucibacter sp. XJ19-41 TaxID=2927824 RepID=UPI0021D50782|nr:PEP-CTERM sorting domain-containing protein [Paucibacter sp. XJ19-41]MCU7376100.1 PEP-CTERM sorting domain-containing protein [Paucibacter sp. O1-1]MDA3831112.1 PEP-CTERM sorting domain-containing protein [Paucibacter sp. O1-1]MDC6171220.1 PEP-CTERM sorting domain-containing protein [Paucibacter sp. XJ19-41]